MARVEDRGEPSRTEALWEKPPFPPTLEDGEVHIWRAWLDENSASGTESAKSLAADELERASRFRHPLDCQRYVRAHVILRSLLGSYLGVEPAKIVFTRRRFGKPVLCLPNPEDSLHFNLSYSKDLAVYALSRTLEVGVDVEFIQPHLESLGLAERFLPPEDIASLRDLPQPRRPAAFFEAWTRMEARQKVSGKGLAPTANRCQVDYENIFNRASFGAKVGANVEGNFFVGDGYAAALALSGCEYRLPHPVRHLDWSFVRTRKLERLELVNWNLLLEPLPVPTIPKLTSSTMPTKLWPHR